ncbi:MAG: hypothetical protein CK429_26055 [Mycobacterium sp.]|jgi:Mce-associated membrane protein|uniref:Mammalian cell entry protein n=1 Tax=Mycobacterium gordonae TaxID=1778 RepID=A0A1A6BET0_MYCGO|nr:MULTISPECIES: hypothetical protein [Mycobacterium]MBI2698045.1 hypothetical protein [Mycobacterium sp.]MBX9981771.1 hypothetical protein [Mycobacterium gordonae]MCQ4360741.1 hypothetical protein [Mycobacterium gordonae]MCV7005766.1 hypothetical protein [Mycobacterium gordonae]OBS00739.1 hypothetical protein A9W98_23340 [Mycobacterium gordonae]
MPRREPSAEALDAGTETVSDPAATLAPDSADLAAIEARAEAARARASELRRQAEQAAGRDVESSAEDEAAQPRRWLPRRWRPRRPRRKAVVVGAAILVSCAAWGGSGYLLWHHHRVVQQQQRSAEFAAAARNAVLTMMSIDPTRARDDLQRFADETTGQFKAGVLMGAEDMVKALEQSKVAAKAAVQAVAVQSMSNDSAVVLVAAKSELIKPDQPTPQMRWFRLVINVERDAGQLKISKIEFVP